MTLGRKILREIERNCRKSFPYEFQQYLLVKYSKEPFPFVYTEHDLYTNIYKDINAYENGELVVTIKKPSERWDEECEYLQNLYIEKSFEVQSLERHIGMLEHILSEHNIEYPKMYAESQACEGGY